MAAAAQELPQTQRQVRVVAGNPFNLSFGNNYIGVSKKELQNLMKCADQILMKFSFSGPIITLRCQMDALP